MYTMKQARVMADMSQEKVAESLNIHVNTYRRIEANPDSITVLLAKKFSKTVNIPASEIFFDSNPT